MREGHQLGLRALTTKSNYEILCILGETESNNINTEVNQPKKMIDKIIGEEVLNQEENFQSRTFFGGHAFRLMP